MLRLKGLLGGLFLACALSLAGLAAPAWALTPAQALRIAQGDSDERIAALNEVVASGDAALVPFVQALLADEVRVAGGRVYIVKDGDAAAAVDAVTRQPAKLPDDAEEVVNNNRMR